MTITDTSPDVLRSDGARALVRYGDDDAALVDLSLERPDARPGAVADLLCEAVRRARVRRTRHLRTALDAGAPSCGVVLDALHGRVGRDVGSVSLRRAGSSVMVTVDLLPAPRRPVRGRSRP